MVKLCIQTSHKPALSNYTGGKKTLLKVENCNQGDVSKMAEQKVSDFIPPAAAAVAKSLQACPTLCDPIDGSPPGSPFPGILQARTLEWVAISFSKEKTLESPFDCKEIQPVHSKGDQSWVFFGRNYAKAETPILWPPHAPRHMSKEELYPEDCGL